MKRARQAVREKLEHEVTHSKIQVPMPVNTLFSPQNSTRCEKTTKRNRKATISLFTMFPQLMMSTHVTACISECGTVLHSLNKIDPPRTAVRKEGQCVPHLRLLHFHAQMRQHGGKKRDLPDVSMRLARSLRQVENKQTQKAISPLKRKGSCELHTT